jgi:glycosyltransferase involved in cell wall biosynthesis
MIERAATPAPSTRSGRLPRGGRREGAISLDVVIPMYEEAPVLPLLLRALEETFSPEARRRHGISRVRCLFVDDGSEDDSVDVVLAHRPADLDVTVVRLSRNFGHQAAVTAGIVASSADVVAVIDADLQDPPACILEMVEKWRDGFEVVYARRRNRKEGIVRVALYWFFYRLYRMLTPISVPVDSGDFCLMSRRVIDELNKLPEKVRFPRGLRSWVGFAQTAIDYDRPARAAGETRYGWGDLYELATDGIAALSLRPLQLAQVLSIVYVFLSGAYAVAILTGMIGASNPARQLSLLLVLTLVSNGLMLFCLYVVGAYLGRAYLEVKARPTYIVAETIESGR